LYCLDFEKNGIVNQKIPTVLDKGLLT